MQVKQDDELDETIGQDRVERYSNQILVLFPPMADIARECQEFEYGMEERDDSGGNQQPRTSLGQHPLDLIHFGTTSLGGSLLFHRCGHC